MKECSKCKESKDSSEYHSDKSKKDGKSSSCKSCKNKQNKDRTQTEEYKSYKKDYDAKYRKTEEGVSKEKRNQERRNELYKTDEDYRQKQLSRGLKHRSKEGAKEKQKIRQQNIPNEIRAKHNREYRQRNKDKFNRYTRSYIKKNKHVFAWRQMLADTHRRMGTTKENYTVEELGYSALDLKNHLQSLFVDGMSWYNHGEWHIDHKKPVSKFSKETKPSIVNSLSNLQPLWAFDNLSKGDR